MKKLTAVLVVVLGLVLTFSLMGFSKKEGCKVTGGVQVMISGDMANFSFNAHSKKQMGEAVWVRHLAGGGTKKHKVRVDSVICEPSEDDTDMWFAGKAVSGPRAGKRVKFLVADNGTPGAMGDKVWVKWEGGSWSDAFEAVGGNLVVHK